MAPQLDKSTHISDFTKQNCDTSNSISKITPLSEATTLVTTTSSKPSMPE